MLDEATLRRLYVEEQRSIRAIAKHEGFPSRTIYDALIRYRIPRRTSGFLSACREMDNGLDETTLRRLYLEEQLSIRAIATMSNISTRVVYDALSRYRIPRRKQGYRSQRPSAIDLDSGLLEEETLRRLYTDEGHSIAAIAALVQSSPSRIRNALVRWDIPRRRRGRPDSIIASDGTFGGSQPLQCRTNA